jgi:hypothetical protein
MAGQLHLDHTPSGIDPGNHTGQIISEGVAFLARQPGTEGNWLRPEEAIALLGRIASRAPQTWQPPGKRVFTGRGRDAGLPAPPAQIPTSGTTA